MLFLLLHDSKSSQQNTQRKSSEADINKPNLENTSSVSKDFEHINQESYFAALEKRTFEKSQRGNSFPRLEQDFKTGGLDVSGLYCRIREFQRQLPTLSPGQEDQIVMQIMSRPRESGLAAVLEGKLIFF